MQRMQFSTCTGCGYRGMCIEGACSKCRRKQSQRTTEPLIPPSAHRSNCGCEDCQNARLNHLKEQAQTIGWKRLLMSDVARTYHRKVGKL